MKNPKLISLVIATSLLFASATFLSANGEETDEQKKYTYYFLAPEDWCMKEYGAETEDVCCYYWFEKEFPPFPGDKMTPAPEIGKNVYKITSIPKNSKGIIFNDGIEYPDGDKRLIGSYTSQTEPVHLDGFDKWQIDEFKFETCSETTNYNGCIFVLDRNRDINNGWDERARFGQWFPLNEYKKYEKYFGSYPSFYNEDNRTFGDLDDDKIVTSADALCALRLSIGIDFYNDFTLSVADTDKDGKLTSADALALLRASIE